MGDYMYILNKIENNSILIVPNNIKEKILFLKNNFTNLLNFKIMDLEKFKKNYFFDYTKESIFFVMKNYNLNYSNSIEILNNLYYVKHRTLAWEFSIFVRYIAKVITGRMK